MAETKYSKEDLRRQVLEDLTVVAIGEALPGELVAKLDVKIQTVFEFLEDERLLIFDATQPANVQVIPARIMQAITEMVSFEVMPSLGLGKPDEGMRENALRKLRRSIFSGRDSSPAQATYF